MVGKRSLAWFFMAVAPWSIGFFGHAEEDPLRSTIEFGGEDREYYVRLPMAFDPEKTYWPLVAVHGGRGNGRNPFLARGVHRAADALGLDAIVVSPSFSNTDFQASRFPALGEGKFLLAVLDDLRRHYRLQVKILLTGYSRGGQFSHRFAFAQPALVQAVAPFAAGTWTTPDGKLLIEALGEIDKPRAFLSDPENASLVPTRLQSIVVPRVAQVAGILAKPQAKDIPFLVMCGTLDTRFDTAQRFAKTMKAAGYDIQTEWPRTPHGSRDKAEFMAEFEKYAQGAVAFFLRVTEKK